jgi:YfiR/HmsC-like
VAFVLSFFLVSATEAQDDDPAAKAAKVKAVFLYNFIKFVEWSAERSPASSQKATICITGNNPFGSALDALKTTLSGKIDLTITTNVSPAALGKCHILFVTPSESSEFSTMLALTRKHNVLTVSEMNDFADKGGIIEMKTVEKTIGLFSSNKINLRINLKAADAASLRINAQLLEIAAEVIK